MSYANIENAKLSTGSDLNRTMLISVAKNIFIFSFIAFCAVSTLGANPLAPDLSDVSYGSDSANKFDLYLAKSPNKTPVVIYYHEGGFRLGDKRGIKSNFVNRLLRCGISVVSANYRFISNTTHYPAPQEDAVRVVQFLRSNANQYNIDASRICLSGSSAGANMAVWIGLHNDMADSASRDSIKRQSTRVTCVVAYDAQTTNDPHWFEQHVGKWGDMYQRFAGFYGVSPREVVSPSKSFQKIIDEASAMNHASSDDPPVFLSYKDKMTPVPLPAGARLEAIVHHPIFGVSLVQTLTARGVESHVYWGKGGSEENPMPPSADLDFLCAKLNPQ